MSCGRGTHPVRRRHSRLLTILVALTATAIFGAVQLPASAVAGSALDALAGPAAAADLDVMTFNLRYADDRNPNSWAARKPAMGELLAAERPDLIGTQEGLSGQLTEIRAMLGTAYDMIGVGREGGTRGEHMAIFFDRTRLTAEQQGHFWLSDTPDVPGSNTWGGGSIRMATWVRFLDQVTGRRFYAVNTHLDNHSAVAREKGAALIRDRLATFAPALPIVLTGDFNSAAGGGPVYDILTRQGGYADTWPAAAKRGPVFGTYHNYQALAPNGPRIDWVLTKPASTVVAAVINSYRGAAGQFPSDHLPVEVRLRLPAAPR